MKQNLNEIKRMQQLAGLIKESQLNEIETDQPNIFSEILKAYIKYHLEDINTINPLDTNITQKQINNTTSFLSAIDKNASTIEELAENIKKIDDFIAINLLGDDNPGSFWFDETTNILDEICFKLKVSESIKNKLFNILEKIYK